MYMPTITGELIVGGMADGEADIVAEGPGNSLQFYWAMPGGSWSHVRVAGSGTTYTAPSLFVRAGGEADIAAEGARNTLQYYYATPGGPWNNTSRRARQHRLGAVAVRPGWQGGGRRGRRAGQHPAVLLGHAWQFLESFPGCRFRHHLLRLTAAWRALPPYALSTLRAWELHSCATAHG